VKHFCVEDHLVFRALLVKGQDAEYGKETRHLETIYDVLDKFIRVPDRPTSAPMRMPISGVYKIRGVGDMLAGRVEQVGVKPSDEGVFLPTTHTASNPCAGEVFTVEMHHQRRISPTPETPLA